VVTGRWRRVGGGAPSTIIKQYASNRASALPPVMGLARGENLVSLSMLGNRFMLAAQYLVSESARSSIQTTATTSAASTKIGRLA
jgi:hypothetical protein